MTFQNQPESEDLLPATASIVRSWNGIPIRFDPVTERLCLTDMHKAAGGESRNKPNEWLSKQRVQALAQEIAQSGNSRFEAGTGFEPYVTIQGGNNAGTWGCIELALAYAEYLNPKFWLWVLQTFVLVRTGQLVPAHQASGLVLADSEVDKIAEAVAPRVAVILRPQFGETISQITGTISQLSRQLEEVKAFLRHDAINGRYNLCQFIQRQMSKPQSSGDSPAPLRSQALQINASVSPSSRAAALEAWARLIAAWWNLFGGKLRRASEIAPLAEAGLLDADSSSGRSKQFARMAERCEGALYTVQDGALKVRLRRGERKAGSPMLYCLEPEL
jgi:hypothetical protein